MISSGFSGCLRSRCTNCNDRVFRPYVKVISPTHIRSRTMSACQTPCPRPRSISSGHFYKKGKHSLCKRFGASPVKRPGAKSPTASRARVYSGSSEIDSNLSYSSNGPSGNLANSPPSSFGCSRNASPSDAKRSGRLSGPPIAKDFSRCAYDASSVFPKDSG